MAIRRYVFDTNIYRYAATYPDFGVRVWEDHHPASASAVVLSELWRSVRSTKSRKLVEELEKRFGKFTFAPTCEDWREVGQYLSTLLPKDGRSPSPQFLNDIRKGQNDALIALSSWNRGFAVVTCDNDFERIRAWARAPAWKLVNLPSPAPANGP